MDRDEPISLWQAIHYKSNSYSDEYYRHSYDLGELISKINRKIGLDIVAGEPGSLAMVHISLPDVTQRMLMALVVMYRKEGWNVSYGTDKNSNPYIQIGITPNP